MYRLIALDIDDTITLNPRVVPNEIIEAVRKAKEHGIHVTVATGRGWWGSKGSVRVFGCRSGSFPAGAAPAARGCEAVGRMGPCAFASTWNNV